MSSDNIAISVSNLSKRYEIYSSPRDRLKQFIFPRLQRLIRKTPKQYFSEFWALKDVSFKIRKGETVGIIGRNGSGKSTLLQMICGTLTPTSGSIQTNVRIAALLELGTGFNPEFTGRENIYLNASVLGLSKAEIDARFEDISNFADIGQFIEQPVKTYSTGMYIRLAFAVIAHVDADILVVDEALAVGDAVFVQKCMRFIHKFKKNGTLIFVSHDASSVMALCDRALWLDKGEVKRIGVAKEVCEDYLRFTMQEIYRDEASLLELNENRVNSVECSLEKLNSHNDFLAAPYGGLFEVSENLNESTGWKTGAAEIISISFFDEKKNDSKLFKGGEDVQLTITAKTYEEMEQPIIGFLVRDKRGQDLFGENTYPFTQVNNFFAPSGAYIRAEFCFQMPMLPNGQYSIMCSIANGDLYNNIQHHWLNEALIFTVASSEIRWGLVGVRMKKINFLGVNEITN